MAKTRRKSRRVVPSKRQMIASARATYAKEGFIEVDDKAPISRARGRHQEIGAYVQAWVWVYDSHAFELAKKAVKP